MNYKEFIAYAEKNYNKGGDAIVECWDENQFNEYVAECGADDQRTCGRFNGNLRGSPQG